MVETLYLSEGSTIFDYFSVKDGIIFTPFHVHKSRSIFPISILLAS